MYPTYADRVALIAVGVDQSESAPTLQRYQQSNGLPWAVARGNPAMLMQYGVLSTMYKFGVDRQGKVAYHGPHQVENAKTWREIFERLASG